MTSRAIQRMRKIRKYKAGRKRKKALSKKGTTPSFASVFGAPLAQAAERSR